MLNFQREMGLYVHKFISVLKAEKIDQSSKDVSKTTPKTYMYTHTRDKAFSEQVFFWDTFMSFADVHFNDIHHQRLST